jgi:hypothetical protein
MLYCDSNGLATFEGAYYKFIFRLKRINLQNRDHSAWTVPPNCSCNFIIICLKESMLFDVVYAKIKSDLKVR